MLLLQLQNPDIVVLFGEYVWGFFQLRLCNQFSFTFAVSLSFLSVDDRHNLICYPFLHYSPDFGVVCAMQLFRKASVHNHQVIELQVLYFF